MSQISAQLTDRINPEGKAVGSVRPSVRLFFYTLSFEPKDLAP